MPRQTEKRVFCLSPFAFPRPHTPLFPPLIFRHGPRKIRTLSSTKRLGGLDEREVAARGEDRERTKHSDDKKKSSIMKKVSTSAVVKEKKFFISLSTFTDTGALFLSLSLFLSPPLSPSFFHPPPPSLSLSRKYSCSLPATGSNCKKENKRNKSGDEDEEREKKFFFFFFFEKGSIFTGLLRFCCWLPFLLPLSLSLSSFSLPSAPL